MQLDGRLSSTDWPEATTPYEADALTFCRAWQSGQSEFVLHTSGSTGQPKPITLTRAQMQASAHLTGQTLGLQPGDASLVCLNVRYIAGVMMLVRGLELGLSMTILEPSGNPLADFPSDTRFDFTALVPLQLQTILEQTPDKLPILDGMKAILIGGAATSPGLERTLQVITAPVYATYGMTETVSHIALRRLNGADTTDVYTALSGVEIGIDERQCLHITAAATNGVLVQTNDVVELLDQRQFRLLGRADSIINTGGVKVQPEAVERIIQDILAALGVSPRLFVAGLPDERLGRRVVAFVEKQPISQDNIQTIQHAIREQLGPYHVPKEMVVLEQFPETPTGKIDKQRIVNSYR